MITTLMSCSCGAVQCQATGRPIVTAACYCDDCQRGSHEIEQLPTAGPVLEADGGTAYVLYRKDRFRCTQGGGLLRNLRLKDSSPTKRIVAGCCNSAMYLDFQKGHWISVYRARLQGPVPDVQMHIQTQFKPHPDSATAPDRATAKIRSYRAHSPRLLAKLLLARLAMLVS